MAGLHYAQCNFAPNKLEKRLLNSYVTELLYCTYKTPYGLTICVYTLFVRDEIAEKNRNDVCSNKRNFCFYVVLTNVHVFFYIY